MMVEQLRKAATNVSDSRNGRYFQGVIVNAVVSVQILSTKEHDYEFEDELMSHGLLFEDAPDACVIEFGIRNEMTETKLKLISKRIAETFDGIDCGITSD